LTTVRRAELALKLEPRIQAKEKAKEKENQLAGLKQGPACPNSEKREQRHTISEVSKAAGISCDTVWKTIKILAQFSVLTHHSPVNRFTNGIPGLLS
jgi:hypothetical protein